MPLVRALPNSTNHTTHSMTRTTSNVAEIPLQSSTSNTLPTSCIKSINLPAPFVSRAVGRFCRLVDVQGARNVYTRFSICSSMKAAYIAATVDSTPSELH